MSETRSTFNATQYLDENDCNITDEYNNFIDGHDDEGRFQHADGTGAENEKCSGSQTSQAGPDYQPASMGAPVLQGTKESAGTARDKLGEQSGKLRRCQGENENL